MLGEVLTDYIAALILKWVPAVASFIGGSAVALIAESTVVQNSTEVIFGTGLSISVLLVLWRLLTKAYDTREALRQDAMADLLSNIKRLEAERDAALATSALHQTKYEDERKLRLSLEAAGIVERRKDPDTQE